MSILHEETIRGGGMTSFVLKRYNSLTITALEGGANVPTLLYNKDNLIERYNMADTLKGQHTFKLTAGNMLYSDMGRAMASITKDTCGWHDTVSGVSTNEMTRAHFGEGTYQDLKNNFHRNGRDNFLIELSKWGLGKQDLVSNLNFFTKIAIGPEGEMDYVPDHSKPDDSLTLRAEMDIVVVLNTCVHPMDPAKTYAPKPVKITITQGSAPTEEDLCRTFRPENERAFQNSQLWARTCGCQSC